MNIDSFRDPLPDEAERYMSTIKNRDKASYLALFDLHPTVMWGSIRKTLSEEDRVWTSRVIKEKEVPEEDPGEGLYGVYHT